MHIILGPPRSGIKLLEDCLGLLGFSSIEDNAGMNAKTVNKLLLQDIGLSPDFSGALPQDWMNYRAAAEARNRINKLLKSMPGFSQSAVYNELHSPLSFLADPFFCHSLPLWHQAFQEMSIEPHYIFILRHPSETALSLDANNENIDLAKARIIWLSHIHAGLSFLRNHTFTMTTFDKLLADPVSTFNSVLGSSFASSRLTLYDLLKFVQPSFKKYHSDSLPEPTKRYFEPFIRFYDQLRHAQVNKIVRKTNKYETGNLGFPGQDTEGKTQTLDDILESVLQFVGQREKHFTSHSVPRNLNQDISSTPQAQIIFPTSSGTEQKTEPIVLIYDRWQKICLSVPDPISLQQKSCIVKPLNTNGTVFLTGLKLIRQDTDKIIWEAKEPIEFDSFHIKGDAVRYSDHDNLLILITGANAEIVLPPIPDLSDFPLSFEFYVKPTKDQNIIFQHSHRKIIRDESADKTVVNHPLIICTHHKAGTNFSTKTFRSIAKKFNKILWMKFYEPNEPQNWDICIQQHSRVEDIIRNHNFKGIRCVRHPKSLILSATYYHEKSNEAWLHVPLQGFNNNTYWASTAAIFYHKINNSQVHINEKINIMNADYSGEAAAQKIPAFQSYYNFNGKTYQEFLQSLPNLQEKVLFEMRSYSRGVINDMLRFPGDQRFFNLHLESVSKDRTMYELREAFLHLGFDKTALEDCLKLAASNCIWYAGIETAGKHATLGLSDIWKEIFVGEVEQEYRKLFGWAEHALGYDK